MKPSFQYSPHRGSVVLLALCFVAVLGISLASYLALSSRAMQLSNRTVKQGQAQQLAELGLEEGLRAMNLNLFSDADTTAALADWNSGGTSVNWSLDPTKKRARATMDFPVDKFGTGITATVKIRIDNYDAGSLDSLWNSSTTYRMGNLVGYNGNWYRGISNDNNKTPNALASAVYWVQENNAISSGMSWTLGTTYAQGNMVLRNSQWYRYTDAGSSTASTTNAPGTGASWSTYWTAVPQLISNNEYTTVFDNQSVLNYNNINVQWYWRDPDTGWWATNPILTWRWRGSYPYDVGNVVCYNQVWYRCHTTHVKRTWSTANWTTVASLTSTAGSASWPWNSSPTYNIGDSVYHSATTSWYRCRIANANQTPSSTSVYWANTPILSQVWDDTRRYNAGDVVQLNGLWYRCRTTGTFGSANNPITDTSDWYSSKISAQQWSATTAYSVGDYRSYGGVWYRCLVANTGISPNNTTCWTPTWTQGSGAVTGGPVIYAEATVNFADGSNAVTQYRAALGRSPLFPNALAATTTLAFAAGTVTSVVSYDSTTDAGAATETYAAVLAAGTASASGTTGLLTLSGSSTTIKGYLAAPAASTDYTPRVSYAANASLLPSSGAALSPAPTAINVDLARISGSPYIPQFSIQNVPTTYGALADISSSITLGTAGGATSQVFYRNGNLTIDGSEIVTIVGPVVININGDLQITGTSNAKFIIAETGSLRLHVSGRLRLDSTGGGIENQTLDPKKCVILSTATSGDHNFSTTQAFHGAIYMPGEDLLVDASTATIYGAISARAISITGNLNFHYDTSLRSADLSGVDRPWAVTEFRELTGSTNLATM